MTRAAAVLAVMSRDQGARHGGAAGGAPPPVKSRLRSLAIVLVFTLLALAAGCNRRPQLATLTHGGPGPPTLVLLHGYGSSAENWEPFTKTIHWPQNGRFVFPQGPEVFARSDGGLDGRAWWPLDLLSHIPPGQSLPDLSQTEPEGLKDAASRVEDLLDGLQRKPGGPIVFGGFSQGAMVASEVAFRSDVTLRALVLLSGTLVDEASWERHFDRRRGMPVFMAHGRADGTLPFATAERFRLKLEAAGVKVTWVPFDGGHEIPATVVIALNRFIDSLDLGRASK
jgi:phospholipase/carboxylesterase